jgi:NADH:ubiquinone oxidoreductase subunit 3 (subunit A)
VKNNRESALKIKKVDYYAISMDVTYYNYIAVGFFILFAIFVPVSFLLTSKMLRPSKPGNRVKNTPYESAEEPIGRSGDVDNEYLAFFAIFLPFEVISMIILLWAVAARSLAAGINVAVIGLLIITMVLALAGYKFASEKR